MSVKDRRDGVAGDLGTSDPLALRLGVRHAGAYTGPDHSQFQLPKHASHLQKRLRHGIGAAVSAIHGDTAHDDETQRLALDHVDDLA